MAQPAKFLVRRTPRLTFWHPLLILTQMDGPTTARHKDAQSTDSRLPSFLVLTMDSVPLYPLPALRWTALNDPLAVLVRRPPMVLLALIVERVIPTLSGVSFLPNLKQEIIPCFLTLGKPLVAPKCWKLFGQPIPLWLAHLQWAIGRENETVKQAQPM